MAAATYKYYFGDLLTGGINYEIPCFGVTYDRRLNKAGNATFSVPLAMKGFNVQDILDNTQVGRGCLYIERNGQIVWGGIIWSRTYQSSSRAFNCTAQTFESFLYKQFIEVKQSFVAEDQRQIVVDLITNMQAKPSANIGIIMPTAFGDPLSTVITRTKDFYSYIGWSYGKAIEDLISYLSGLDYSINVAYDVNGVPQKYLQVGNILGISQTSSELAFDFPGNIKDYIYPETATDAVTTMLGFGGGSGGSITRTKYIRQDLLTAGYPDLQGIYDNSNIYNINDLVSQTKAAGDLAAIPILLPTITVDPSANGSLFGGYALGDYFTMHVEDIRWPTGHDVVDRIIGWKVIPSSSTSQETVQLIVTGQ